MKYVITESQVDNLIRVFTNFVNSESYEGVCDILVDYDDVMSRFVINIFFKKKYLLSLGSGSNQTSFLRKTVNEVGKTFFNFTRNNPLMYQHYGDC